jgi:uncharacterized protein
LSKTLEHVISEVKSIMPIQGPLEFFVHHNTLHEFENLPFKEGILKGQNLYQGHVLKSLNDYQSDLKSKKINPLNFNEQIKKFLTENDLHSELFDLCYDLLLIEDNNLKQTSQVSDLFNDLREVRNSRSKFYSTALKQNYDIDMHEVISPTIFRFCSLYFDHGISYWNMPTREKGLLKTFISFYKKSSFLSAHWEKYLSRLISKFAEKSNAEIIQELLNELLIEPIHYHDFLFDVAYQYKGWCGLIISFEKHPEWNKKNEVSSNFEDLLCILLLCKTAFIQNLGESRRLKIEKIIPLKIESKIYSDSFLNQASSLISQKYPDIDPLFSTRLVRALTDFERKYIYHLAFEETFYSQFLRSFSQAQKQVIENKSTPRFQVMTCIDDREESFRRYVEEGRGDIETFGVAGHFGLDIKFKGIFNAHRRALCPDIVKPSKIIDEQIIGGFEAQKIYKFWSSYLWAQNHGSKTLVRGIVFQFLLGMVSLFSLVIYILFPFSTSRIGENIKSMLNKRIKTKLLFRDVTNSGLSPDDMVRYGRNLLKTIGLLDKFAPVVVILGHGSHSLNNPHESAYNCGACGGGKGAPNARLISTILNDPQVRKELAKENINIPDSTHFLPGFHNTCSDEVLFFDVPDNDDVKEIIGHIREASKKDAKERCRRFPDVSLSIEPDQAYNHCLARANNYMEARPEYNHATNALCIVGPRSMTKDIFLDRRSFLVSYEASLDNENSEVLKNILSAVGPVCTGINLEYYFSFMDNEVYGCGSKLPHNVSSLLGVMNGYQSDLRMGLSQQMIEIHDPFRLMLMVVAQPKQVLKLLSEIKSFDNLANNDWMQLCIYDPTTKNLYRYEDQQMKILDFTNFPETIYKSNFTAFNNSRESCDLGVLRGI